MMSRRRTVAFEMVCVLRRREPLRQNEPELEIDAKLLLLETVTLQFAFRSIGSFVLNPLSWLKEGIFALIKEFVSSN